jgi:hypothetical protein
MGGGGGGVLCRIRASMNEFLKNGMLDAIN